MTETGRPPGPSSAWPMGGGVTGELIRSIDWSKTEIGAVASWPPALTTIVETLLSSRHPMFLWWGPELIQFYNDAYMPSFGHGKHPAAMGQRGPECWGEIWPIIGPQIQGVMTRGEPTWHEDALVPIFRNDRIEEVFWTYGYSPVFTADRRVGGTLVVCTETTSRVLAARRQRLLRMMSERISSTTSHVSLFEKALSTFSSLPEDLPFALFLGREGAASTTSVGLGDREAHELLRQVASWDPSEAPTRLALDVPIAASPWPEPVNEVFAVPVRKYGVLLFGLSPRLGLDIAYRDFLGEIAENMVRADQRREALAVRATAEAERRDLLMQAPVATAIFTGPDHLFELANPLYVEMVGREVLGKTYLEAFPELAGSELSRIMDGVYQNGVPFVAEELLVPLDREKTGLPQPCFFRFNLQPIRDSAEVVVGMMAIAIDITAMVRSRDAQASAHELLRQAHDERTDLVKELESANRAKDEFLAMLGHELRNPLAPIVTAIELVKRRGGPPAAEYEIIERQVDHVVRLVDDLLDVSRISSGKFELKREPTDLKTVIEKAVEMSASLFEQRRHQLHIQLTDGPVMMWGDPVRLAQVVANLLTNAARYTDPEGIVHLSLETEHEAITVRVRDNGKGIPAELLPIVFDLFVQGSRLPDRAQGGLGLGLTLVKHFVDLHGGRVTASSDGLGRGSEFVVELPRRELPPSPSLPKKAPASRPERKRILVVDDNVDAADLLSELLRAHGHEVEVAHDAVMALDVFPRFRPQVAILDIGLPVMDGYELAAKVAASGANGECRLIAVTGYGQARDKKRASEAGFHLHFVKPVNLQSLLEAVEASSV